MSADTAAVQEPARAEGVPSPRVPEAAPAAAVAAPEAPALDKPAARAAETWVPDSPTRRRSVVFEEDDDLDVPDFLK